MATLRYSVTIVAVIARGDTNVVSVEKGWGVARGALSTAWACAREAAAVARCTNWCWRIAF